ncbi:hypothetical protein M885DRAFT_67768 [Pelagophyceae sp. CCMP2097]|nr:hypothetical protein M885DRAFT_67768 [Pelagophyceae sp. CCMP2097]
MVLHGSRTHELMSHRESHGLHPIIRRPARRLGRGMHLRSTPRRRLQRPAVVSRNSHRRRRTPPCGTLRLAAPFAAFAPLPRSTRRGVYGFVRVKLPPFAKLHRSEVARAEEQGPRDTVPAKARIAPRACSGAYYRHRLTQCRPWRRCRTRSPSCRA